ncbi:Mss4-like protein [Panaeolus papilionaceus]|nr:Mss4-like protein [Panaeolus papilionaceus]
MSSPPSSSSPESIIRKGSCLCRAVHYEVTGEPITFRVCHCVNCRKSSGTAFMSSLFFNGKQLMVITGGDKVKVYSDRDTGSGYPINRFFCGECGSNLFRQPANPEALAKDLRVVTAGTLDEEINTAVKTELFPELKRDWVVGIHVQQKKSKL